MCIMETPRPQAKGHILTLAPHGRRFDGSGARDVPARSRHEACTVQRYSRTHFGSIVLRARDVPRSVAIVKMQTQSTQPIEFDGGTCPAEIQAFWSIGWNLDESNRPGHRRLVNSRVADNHSLEGCDARKRSASAVNRRADCERGHRASTANSNR